MPDFTHIISSIETEVSGNERIDYLIDFIFFSSQWVLWDQVLVQLILVMKL